MNFNKKLTSYEEGGEGEGCKVVQEQPGGLIKMIKPKEPCASPSDLQLAQGLVRNARVTLLTTTFQRFGVAR